MSAPAGYTQGTKPVYKYCLRCHGRRQVRNPEPITYLAVKRGYEILALLGTCVSCGCKAPVMQGHRALPKTAD
jgi:hypothetical protein